MIYEQRTYFAAPSKMPDLLARFEQHTIPIWERIGIRPLQFWRPTDEDARDQLIYMLEWQDEAERERLWGQFMADPEWQAAYRASEADGPLLTGVDIRMVEAVTFPRGAAR